MFLGGCQDEDGVCGRLFERFQERIEGGSRQHMHLVDDIDAVTTHLRRDTNLIHKRANVIDRVVRRSV